VIEKFYLLKYLSEQIMNTKVSQMTIDELREVIGLVVEEKLATLFGGNEDELEFTDELQEILSRQSREIENGERGESLEEVAGRLSLE